MCSDMKKNNSAFRDFITFMKNSCLPVLSCYKIQIIEFCFLVVTLIREVIEFLP